MRVAALIALMLVVVADSFALSRLSSRVLPRGSGGLYMSTTEEVETKAPESVSDVAREIIEKQFKIGKRVQWGVFQGDVKEEDVPDAGTRAALREIAARELVNIDDEERARRTTVGKVGGVVAAVSYFAAVYLGLDIVPRTALTYFPLALSLGFLESGKQGL